MQNLIIEGLTGAGKSQTIKELVSLLAEKKLPYKVFSELETFGDFIIDLNNQKLSNKEKCFMLEKILEELELHKDKVIILERFHFSYYAFLKDWSLYDEIDKKLQEKNFLQILLTYDEKLFFERAIKHNDRITTNSNWEAETIEYFGSIENALSEYKKFQDNRLEALAYTKLPILRIDTSKKLWEEYAKEILLKE